MTTSAPSLKELILIDAAVETERIVHAMADQLRLLKRRGLVLGLSGGVDSSVAAALAVRAAGKDRVLGLLMPEADSSGESLRLGQLMANHLGISAIVEDITTVLEATGCYERRDAAIRTAFPAFTREYKLKLAMDSILETDRYRVTYAVVESPAGTRSRVRLSAEAYRTVVAATNFKQRVRKMLEYFHADRLQYAVLGTPNRLEYDQGFFVKNGDGSADLKPLAHLYKTQVYRLAEYLGIPEEIRTRPPTTDTFSLAQSQEEFYFSLPYDKMDLFLAAKDRGIDPSVIARELALTESQVERVFADIDSKRAAARYLHERPLLVEAVGHRE